MSIKLITAIKDKKSQTIGRPIFQENIEKAISGVQDALNSMNTQGEYLMPAHREHPEDYSLVLLGYYDDELETTSFDAETGQYKREMKNTPVIKSEEKLIVEFKDLNIKDVQSKISAEQVYNLVNQIQKSNSQDIYDSITKALNDHNKTIKAMIENINKPKKGFWLWKK